jgi:hypothetical protein
MNTVKPNLGPHAPRAGNPLSFDEAYDVALAYPNRRYRTTAGQIPFIVVATRGKKGKHANERVLRFMGNSIERARSYECCWGYRTNCNSTHIDIYTEAIHRRATA